MAIWYNMTAMNMKTVYFDNNATTQVAPEVRDVMLPFLCELYGNPSSMHVFGGRVAKFLDRAREEVAAFINAEPDEIIFTACATESDNAAIRGAAEFSGAKPNTNTNVNTKHSILLPIFLVFIFFTFNSSLLYVTIIPYIFSPFSGISNSSPKMLLSPFRFLRRSVCGILSRR